MSEMTVEQLRHALLVFSGASKVYVEGEPCVGIVGSADEHGYTISLVGPSYEHDGRGYFLRAEEWK